MSTVTVRSENGDKTFDCDSSITLLDLLSSEGFPIAAPCGGEGKCGKCAVTLVSPDGTRERVNACQIRTGELGGRVVLAPDAASGGEIQLEGVGAIPGAGGLSGYAAALDIGTTTLAVRVIDRATGAALASASAWNAQAPYGADVISRIKHASKPGGLEKLTTPCAIRRGSSSPSPAATPTSRTRILREITLRGQHDDGAHLCRNLAREHRPCAVHARNVLRRRRRGARRGVPERAQSASSPASPATSEATLWRRYTPRAWRKRAACACLWT